MKTISELSHNPNNPRIHDGDRGEKLGKSISKYGDLSSVIYNVNLKMLVGGHFRTKVIPPESMLEKHEVIDQFGTVAEGTIILPTGQRLAYREVDWNQKEHDEATVMANNYAIQGEYDRAKLEEYMTVFKEDKQFFEESGFQELSDDFEFGFDPDDVEEVGEINENCSFQIKCDDMNELEEMQSIMKTESNSMQFKRFKDAWLSR